jgi:arylsulfatase A-like enzyme
MAHWLPILTIVLSCVCEWSATSVAARPTERPNILFILADDQRWDTIHALGNEEIHTPNLDRLVENGFSFSNVYCMGSMSPAVCLPSRTMLLTGRSVWRLPQVAGVEAPPDLVLLPRVLHNAGYVTYHCGKANNACRYGNAAFDFNVETAKTGPADMRLHGDQIVKFLEEHDRNKPFFMYLAPPVPHDPRVAPAKFAALYNAETLNLPRNFMPAHPFDNGELKIRDEMLAAHPRTPQEMRKHLAEYYACISDLDEQVGRIVGKFADLKYAQNTIVIFSSDQGLAVGGRHGLMGKQNLYEHVKPPLVISGPGVPHGQSDALVYLYDLFPTICEFARSATPDIVEGKSLAPIVRGEKAELRPYLFAAYRDWQRMVRDERWKLIEYVVNDEHHTQLFDLSTDMDEFENLAGKESSRPILNRLRAQLLQLAMQFEDPNASVYRQALTGEAHAK